MLSFTVIGCGAAGNKAVIDLMGIGYNPSKCYLVNSTAKDIPSDYHDNMIIFGASSNRLGGCGKERSIGREMLLTDLKAGKLDLDALVDPNDQAIVLVGSTEGGSGSSSIPILAKYFKQVHGKNVICVFFFGFNDDVRGMQNSIELCKELSEEYTVIGISNEKFLANGNKFAAEKKANELFCDIVKTLTGAMIVPGPQMIDDTDLYKVVTTPGYMIVNNWAFNRPKNADSYISSLKNFLDNQGFVDPGRNPGAKRIAMIFNIPGSDDNIDYRGTTLREMYGEPYEFFTHLNDQSDGYFISFIVSGMNLPSEEIQNIYDEYMERTTHVNKSRDSFFDMLDTMDAAEGDAGFDMLTNTHKQDVAVAKSSFFADFSKAPKKPESDY